MIAETSINDVLLVVAGGAIGIVGSYFHFRWSRSQRAVERVMEAYSDYISATENMLGVFVAQCEVAAGEKTSI